MLKRSPSRRLLLVLAAVLALPPAARAAEPNDEILDPLTVLTAESARAKVTALAAPSMEGRRAGTPGAERAAAFIAEGFRRAGLEPGGENGTWFQTVKVPPAVLPGTGNVLSIAGESRTFTLSSPADFVPFGFTATARAKAPVVFAGYGLSDAASGWDDYAGLDVKGRIVLVLRHGPGGAFERAFGGRKRELLSFSAKALNAQEHGAAGMILVTDPAHLKEPETLAFLSGGASGVRIPCVHAVQKVGNALLGLVGRNLESVQAAMNGEGKPWTAAIPAVEVELATVVERGADRCVNVVGVLRGTDPVLRDECVVIGGHYDHLGWGDIGAIAGASGEIFPGADDNASGTAGVMAVAEAFCSLPWRPRRSIVFAAFTGEEVGLFGSREYAGRPLFPASRTVAMFALDMLGRSRSDRVSIGGVGTGHSFESVLREANETAGLKLGLSKAAYPGSDHASFYAKKIPVLFFCTGIHPDYHRPTDTADKIDYQAMEKIVRLVFLAAARLASADERPRFEAVRTPQRTGQQGPKMGILPDMGFDGVGARVAGVSPGTPAEKAGLKEGDIIIEFGGKPVDGMAELFVLLSRVKPGAEVKLAVLRAGERLEPVLRFEK